MASSGNAQAEKEKTGGILQQTGESVFNAAQGAANTVKSTLGIGENPGTDIRPKVQEKKEPQVLAKGREAVDAAKEKASVTAQTARDTAQEKVDTAKENVSVAAQSARETAQAEKEKTGSILQQAGESVINAAQGATNTVKSTLGIGENQATDTHKP